MQRAFHALVADKHRSRGWLLSRRVRDAARKVRETGKHLGRTPLAPLRNGLLNGTDVRRLSGVI